MQIFLIISLIIAVVAVVFAIQNTDPTSVSFFVWQFKGSLAFVLIIAMLAGVAIGSFASLPSLIKSKLVLRKQSKRITELETELNEQMIRLEEGGEITQAKDEVEKSPPQSPPQKPEVQ